MKLAEIQTINEIIPIEGADRIVLAKVQGWQSVIQRDQFKVGDRIIFVPIDTVLQPEIWNSFLQSKSDPTAPIRVKTAKLRGTISQGLIFPLSILPDPFFEHEVGTDVADLIGVTKYEKPIPAHLVGQMAGDFPSNLVSKTDEDNLKSNIEVLEELKQADFVEATLKIDGTSATYIKEANGTFRVCSRNIELKDTESNVHWQMARKYDIENNLVAGNCIQGEIAGPAIQGNPAGFSEVSFFAFNLINLGNRKPIYRDSWFTGMSLIGNTIPNVPRIRLFDKETFSSMSIDDLQQWVNEITYENKKPAEGIVFRGVKEGKLMYSHKLQKMLSVKIINQNYKD